MFSIYEFRITLRKQNIHFGTLLLRIGCIVERKNVVVHRRENVYIH